MTTVRHAPTPATRLRPFTRSLPMQLVRAREALMQRFRPHLHEHGLTDQQWRILRALAETKAVEIGELSERCCIHPASLSRILPKLDAAGLTTRRLHAGDKRKIMISLTVPGRRMVEHVMPRSDEVYAAVGRTLGVKRMRETYRVLDELIAALAQADEASSRAASAKRQKRART
ncbi:MAG: homoprotocatechuate degradation operon regulator HpaR [Variibacter sp.]